MGGVALIMLPARLVRLTVDEPGNICSTFLDLFQASNFTWILLICWSPSGSIFDFFLQFVDTFPILFGMSILYRILNGFMMHLCIIFDDLFDDFFNQFQNSYILQNVCFFKIRRFNFSICFRCLFHPFSALNFI